MPIQSIELPIATASYKSAARDAATQATPWFIGLVVLLITCTYIMPIGDALKSSVEASHTRMVDDVAVGAKDGVLSRQLAFAAMGLVGLIGICWPGGRRLAVTSSLGVLCLTYVGWCLLSCIWAEDPGVSIRGLVAACFEGAFGVAIARRATPRQYVWIAFFSTAIWLTLGVACELALGTFHPGGMDYRFAGVFHPNDMGVACAILSLSSLYLARSAPRKWLFWSVAGIGLVFLVLTGSRTSLGCMLVVAAAGWMYFAPQHRRVIIILSGVFLAAVFGLLLQHQIADKAADVASLGRSDGDVSSFTGRVPLWQVLSEYISRRPWVGYGYNSFWTAEHIVEVCEPDWGSVTNAHSLYVNSVLNIGLIGAALCIASLAGSLLRSIQLERRFPDIGFGFMSLVLTYSLISGFAETTFGITKFLPCMTVSAICFLVFCVNDGAQQTQRADQSHKLLEPARLRDGHSTA